MYRSFFLSLLSLGVLCFATPTKAQIDLPETKSEINILNSDQAKEKGYGFDNTATHPALKLTPDKSEIVRLDRPAGIVIVGNPLHINVLVDSTNTLVVVPRAPGASNFIVLDQNEDVIMNRHVLVSAPTKNYVRIRRSCGNSPDNCEETSMYYCPDLCHEITMDNSDNSIGSSESNSTSEDDGNTFNEDTIIPDEE